MPLITQPFDLNRGPTLTVKIAFPVSLHSGSEVPESVEVNMLIDTGASWTSVGPLVATKLNLPVLGLRGLKSVTHEVQANEYLADMYLPVATPPFHLKDLRLVEFAMGDDNVGGLIGRDLLRHGLFQMDGKHGLYTLAF